MILNYNEFGEGKTIVILHGLLGSLGNWVSLAKVLSERFHVILVDLPNHGQSHHTDHFSYESMAKEVSFLLKHNELCNINLIGHSMGGKVAMKYAELFSDNTSKLVIVDIANRNYKSNKFTHIFDGISSLNLSDIKSRVDADKLIKSFVPNLGERNFLLKNLKREEGTFKWSPNIHLLKSSLDKISSKINIKNKILTDTLFLKGEKSNYINKADSMSDFLQFNIIEIKNSGHWLHADNPKEFLKEVVDFI